MSPLLHTSEQPKARACGFRHAQRVFRGQEARGDAALRWRVLRIRRRRHGHSGAGVVRDGRERRGVEDEIIRRQW
jgi:hypothetical protein